MALPNYMTESRTSLESVSRAQFQAAPFGDHVLCRVLGKYKMLVSPDDWGISPHLVLDGFWESWITLFMARTVRPGWRCIDLGANQGYYSLLMADAAGSEGRLLAVEPNPRLSGALEGTMRMNGFGLSTDVLRKAMSDTRGVARLTTPPHAGLNGTITHEPRADEDVTEVETITLDEAVREWPRVDFMKIDVEGAEEAVWRGMGRTLERNPGIAIVLEYNAGRYADPAAFLGRIRSAGFPLRFIDYDGVAVPVSEETILSTRLHQDWMLYLARQ